ncbi:hypothetical protein D3C73_1583950 [compost metagenome]
MLDGLPMIEGYSRVGEFVPLIGKEAGDFITQTYQYLSTIGEFIQAVSILEEGQPL